MEKVEVFEFFVQGSRGRGGGYGFGGRIEVKWK